MSKTIKMLWSFAKLLIQRWLSLLIYYGTLIGAIFTFRILKVEIASFVFWILALIGLFWASFRVYKKMYIDYEGLKKKVTKKDLELIVKPELSIMLLEGNEYSYSLSKEATYLRQKIGDEYVVPDSSIELHLRILNIGTVGLDILSIKSDFKDIEIPWTFWARAILKEKGNELSFPRHLSVKEILLCDLTSSISAEPGLNEAQFAAQFVKINKESKRIASEVKVEARDSKGEIHNFSHTFEAALRPLMDLYVNRWQEKNQTKLLYLIRSEDE